jgi:hypothetical protein
MFEKITDLYRRISPVFHLILSIAYGLLVIFCLIGALAGKGYVPVVGIVLVCLSWASARILREASIALQILTHVLKGEKSEENADDDGDHS